MRPRREYFVTAVLGGVVPEEMVCASDEVEVGADQTICGYAAPASTADNELVQGKQGVFSGRS